MRFPFSGAKKRSGRLTAAMIVAGCAVAGAAAATAETARSTAAPAAQTAPVTAAPTPTPVTLPGAETHVYRPLAPEPLRLHVFKPAGWHPGDRRAAFVWFFGGGWTGGTPQNAAGWTQWAAQRGFVGIAPDYRTRNRFGTSPLESVADARAALHWIEEHAAELGIDPQQIVVGGNSAGGHVALWTAIARTPPGSSVDEAPRLRPAALVLTSPVSDTTKEKGYTPARFGENARALSPVDQLEVAAMPPLLLFHGDADKVVPQRQSLALRDKLLAGGGVCEFVSVPGGSHNFGGDLPEWREKSRALVEAFLRQHGLWRGEK
jgi:acetyl esterase/lipase